MKHIFYKSIFYIALIILLDYALILSFRTLDSFNSVEMDEDEIPIVYNKVTLRDTIHELITNRNYKINVFDGLYISQAVQASSKEFNLDPYLIIAIIEVESGYNYNATSHCGAMGVMQLMPITANSLANRLGLIEFDPYDINDNIRLGSFYLSRLLSRYKRLDYVASAYNGGNRGVNRYKKYLNNELPLSSINAENYGYINKVTTKYKELRNE